MDSDRYPRMARCWPSWTAKERLSTEVKPRDLTKSGLNTKPLVQQIEPQITQVICNWQGKLLRTQCDQIVTHSSHILSIPVTFSHICTGLVRS